jgi:hypothetical protein
VKYSVQQFKSMQLALKDLEQFVRNPALLQTGRPLKQFGGMLPREILANWLLCATVNAVEGRRLVFSSDPTGGDGIIRDEATCELFLTEHTMVSPFNLREGADAQTLILEAIEKKRAKGEPYASKTTLVVYLDADAGVWFPNSVARVLPDPLHFATVWVASFLKRTDDGEYTYGVTHLDVSKGEDAPAFLVRIAKVFDGWEVVGVQ